MAASNKAGEILSEAAALALLYLEMIAINRPQERSRLGLDGGREIMEQTTATVTEVTATVKKLQ